MELNKAISDLAQIRAQLDRTESYRGFRSQTVGLSALMVFVASFIQQFFPVESIDLYLKVWLTVACLSFAAACLEMVVRGAKSESHYVWKMHRRLMVGMIPAFITGGAMTALLVSPLYLTAGGETQAATAPLAWALPGVWAMTYSLGLFSCRTHLTRHTKWIACYFLGVGLFLVLYGFWWPSLFVWQMPLSFGVGQLIFAVVLFLNTERTHD